MLAYAPIDAEDHAWPTRPVREVFEEYATDEIERGIRISRFNMRGVFRKDMYEGGHFCWRVRIRDGKLRLEFPRYGRRVRRAEALPPKFVPRMQEPIFINSFLNKGRMRSLPADIPVKIVLNDNCGITGAARYTLIQKAFETPTRASA